MKKIVIILSFVLFVLSACEPNSNDVSNVSFYTGETICTNYYGHDFALGYTTYRASYYIESEDGEITSAILRQTWDISEKSEEEVNSIIDSFGPAIRFEYKIDGNTLIIAFPLRITIDLTTEVEGAREIIDSFASVSDLEYEIDGDMLRISGYDIETRDISGKSEEEVSEIIDSFGSPIGFEYELTSDTLTQTLETSLEGIMMMQGNLNIGSFIARVDNEDRGYSCN